MGKPIIQGEQCYDEKLGYYYDYSNQIEKILQNASLKEKYNGESHIHLKHALNDYYENESVASNTNTQSNKYNDIENKNNYIYVKNRNYNPNIYSNILFYEIRYKKITYQPIRKANAINFMSLKS